VLELESEELLVDALALLLEAFAGKVRVLKIVFGFLVLELFLEQF